ncbi:MAG: HAMP domain-containing histidine kinase [Clostridia bacterium]|nr:HAMP domain-containing histidine kinase [Clostridia bacterium]
MFTRIMSLVLAVVLFLTAGFAVLGAFLLHRERVDARLAMLQDDARDIARIAAACERFSYQSFQRTFPRSGSDNTAYALLTWKVRQVYDDFDGGYISVANRINSQWVQISDNLSYAAAEDPDFVASLNSDELQESLARVLQGREILVRATMRGEPVFTVGVPYVTGGQVVGAALIQTPVRTIEGNFWELGAPLISIALAAIALAAVILVISLRRQLRPLQDLTRAAETLAEGDFSARVPDDAAVPEMHALSAAFNSMADQLGRIETGRREFVANVSHELRSPITSISGFVQGMEDGTIPPEDHPKYLSLVSRETRRLSKLVSDLLALSRLERDDAALHRTEFDLCEMLRRAVIRRAGDLEKKGIMPVTEFGADPCRVYADADRIEEVVINLMDNAIKFTPEGGHITLRTAWQHGKALCTIADDGPGVAEEDRPLIFDRFFTADRAHTAGKGTGLGLPICQRIMVMHGERIWLAAGGPGAVFCFTLPPAGKRGDA